MEKEEEFSPHASIEEFEKLPEDEKEITSTLCCRRCHHWDECSAPLCPLDPRMEVRIKMSDEEKCSLSKNKRRKLAVGLPLLYEGMTKKEFAGSKAWQNMTEEKKREIINQFVKN